HGVPGAALAVARGGCLVLARGYGLADVERQEPVLPSSLFALQSVSKTLTAIAVMQLVEAGKVTLDAPVFPLLNPAPPPGATADPRLAEVTVRHLLNPSAGWPTQPHNDPRDQQDFVTRRLNVAPPPTAEHLVRVWLEVPLDFAPGTRQEYMRVTF